jgi:uncharacterized membrane protein
MNSKFILMSAIFLVMVLATTSAAAITGSNALEMCQCETVKETYSVCADSAGTYNVTANGSASNWLSIAPTTLNLNAGECEDVFVFVTPECYATSGTFNATLNVNGNETATKDVAVRVKQCHTFDYAVTPVTNASKACEEKTYEIYVRNTGKFNDAFVLNQSGIDDSWAEYSSNKFILIPGEVLNTTLVVKSSCDAQAENYPFALELSNTKTNASETENLNYTITDFDSLTTTFPANVITCAELGDSTTFYIKNASDKADEFTLTLEAPEAITLSTNTLSLAEGEIGEIVLTVNPTEPLTGFIGLTIHSNVYGKDYAVSSELEIQDCYAHEIERVSAQTDYCIGANEEKIKVTNNGTKPSTMTVTTAGIITETKQVTIPAKQSEVITLNFNRQEVGDVIVTVEADSGYNKAVTDFNLAFEDCYGTQLVAPSLDVCKGKTMTRNISLTNNGTKTQTYELETNADWITLDKTSATLSTGETEQITMSLTIPQALQDNYVVKATSDNATIQRSLPVTILSEENCYSYEITQEPKQLDVNCCSGEIVELLLTNAGQFDQTIEISKEAPPWVSFSEDNVEIKEGETKSVFVYFSPPAGTNGTVISTINLENQKGFIKSIDYNLNVFGGNCGAVLGADLSVGNQVAREKIHTRKEFQVEFEIMNDSNIGFNVTDMNVDEYLAYFEFESDKYLAPEGTMTVTMTVVFEEKDVPSDPVDVNVNVLTSVGVFTRKQTIDFEKLSVDEPVFGITGNFLEFVAPAAGILLLIIILAIIVIVAAKAKPKASEPKNAPKKEVKKTKSTKKASKKKK